MPLSASAMARVNAFLETHPVVFGSGPFKPSPSLTSKPVAPAIVKQVAAVANPVPKPPSVSTVVKPAAAKAPAAKPMSVSAAAAKAPATKPVSVAAAAGGAVKKAAPVRRRKPEEGSRAERKILEAFERAEDAKIAARNKGLTEDQIWIRDQESYVASLRSELMKRAYTKRTASDPENITDEELMKRLPGYPAFLMALRDLADARREAV